MLSYMLAINILFSLVWFFLIWSLADPSDEQEEVAKEFNIPVQFQRFWLWAKRQNHTYRPNRPLTPMEEAQSVNSWPWLKLFFMMLLIYSLSSFISIACLPHMYVESVLCFMSISTCLVLWLSWLIAYFGFYFLGWTNS